MTAASPRRVVGLLAVAVVAGAVTYGLTRVGSPSLERERRLDGRRAEDLRAIADMVDLHWSRSGSLPPSLDQLSDTPVRNVALDDPATEAPYEYRVLTDSTFELCAFFATDWTPPSVGEFWSHPVGRHCFALEAHHVKRERPSSADHAPR